MSDDGEVLRFRPRGRFEEDVDDDEYECRLQEPYDDFDRYRGHGRPGRSGLAELAGLARIVGGDETLAAVDVQPLEPVELSLVGIRDDLHDRVRGSPDLSVARFRRRLVLVRDLALQLRARTPAS